MKNRYLSILACLGSAVAVAYARAEDDTGEWYSLFNGRDLSGWTVKIN